MKWEPVAVTFREDSDFDAAFAGAHASQRKIFRVATIQFRVLNDNTVDKDGNVLPGRLVSPDLRMNVLMTTEDVPKLSVRTQSGQERTGNDRRPFRTVQVFPLFQSPP